MKTIKFIAITLLLTLISSCYKTTDEFFYQAELYDKDGQFKEAIQVIKNILDRESNNIGALINMGAYNSSLNNIDSAISYYQKALKVENDNSLALFNLAKNHAKNKDYQKALNFFKASLKSKGFIESPQSEFNVPLDEIYIEIAYVYLNLNDSTEACKFFSMIKDKEMVQENLSKYCR